MNSNMRLAAFCFAVTMLFGSLLHPDAAKADISKSFGAPQDLGTPVTQIGLDDAAFAEFNGVDYMYTTENGNPAVLNVVNLDTNELVKSFPLEGARDSWTHAVGPNGDVYITATGKLFVYSPATGELRDLGKHSSRAAESYAIALDEEGNVYGGTYPNSQLYKYDASTGEYTNYGTLVEGQDYIRSLAYYDGYVYAGTGAGNAKLIKFHPETKEKTEIAFPDRPEYYDVHDISFVYGLDAVDHYLFVHLKESNVLIIYDLEQERWLDETFDHYNSLNVAEEPYKHNAYFVAGGIIYSFNIETEEFEHTGLTYSSSVRGVGWITVDDDPDFPGKSLAFQTWGGSVHIYNFEQLTQKTLPPVVKGQPTTIQALEKGPDGKLYISGFRSSRGAVFNPATQEVEPFSLGQAEGIGSLGDKVYFGVYSGAYIYELDTTQSPAQATEIFQIKQNQDRPFTLTSGEGKLFIGTVPTYGELGGALTVYDPATGEHQTYRNVVENQSVIGLAYQDGKIYGSTSVWGGLSKEPTEAEAKIFVWDVERAEKIAEFVPELDVELAPKAIGELSFGPDGLLWGAALGTLFAMDPDTQEVIKSKTIEQTDWNYNQVWRPRFLRWGEDGYLYTNLGTDRSKINVFDPDTLEHITLQNAALMTLGDDGNIYYSDGAQLKMIPVYDGPAYSVIPLDVELVNPSFEEPFANDDIPGWNADLSSKHSHFELSTDRAYDGVTSLKLMDTSQDAAVIVTTDEIPVIPGAEYTAQMKVYLENGRSLATFHFYDQDGEKLQDNAVTITSGHGHWQDVSITTIAPEGSAYAKIGAMISNFYVGTAYYDAFRVTYEAYETAPTVIGADHGILYTAESDPTITVQGDARSNIYIFSGGDAIAVVDSTGEEQPIQLHGLIEGEYEFTIRAIYENGKVSLTRKLLLVVDQTAPAAPVVLDPKRPWSTNDRTPKVTIQAEPGSLVSIVEDGEVVGTAKADETGIAVVEAGPLAQGIHKMKAYAEDSAGNRSDLVSIPHIIIHNGK